MKTLHILVTLALSISTHFILILGIQGTVDSIDPHNNNPIQVSLSTSHPKTQNAHEKTATPTKANKQKNQQASTNKAATPKITPVKTTAPKQTIKSAPVKKRQQHKKPTLALAQAHTPLLPAIKKTAQAPSQQSDILSEARALTQIRTKYPKFSRRIGEEGLVKLAINIDDEGNVTNINIVQSSGHSRLDKAAKKAVEQATFKPATLNNKVVASIKKLSIKFDLRDPS